jgi:hypothetical protein
LEAHVTNDHCGRAVQELEAQRAQKRLHVSPTVDGDEVRVSYVNHDGGFVVDPLESLDGVRVADTDVVFGLPAVTSLVDAVMEQVVVAEQWDKVSAQAKEFGPFFDATVGLTPMQVAKIALVHFF